MSLDNRPPIDLVRAHTAIVGTLGSREPIFGPTERMLVLVKEGVFLLNAEPGPLVLGPI